MLAFLLPSANPHVIRTTQYRRLVLTTPPSRCGSEQEEEEPPSPVNPIPVGGAGREKPRALEAAAATGVVATWRGGRGPRSGLGGGGDEVPRPPQLDLRGRRRREPASDLLERTTAMAAPSADVGPSRAFATALARARDCHIRLPPPCPELEAAGSGRSHHLLGLAELEVGAGRRTRGGAWAGRSKCW